MKQSVTKLVDVILQKLAEHPEGGSVAPGLRTWLLRQGYAKPDIDAALKMVEPAAGSARGHRSGPGSIRQLSDYESYRLSPEARDALARLEIYEMIDPHEREMLLERLDQFEGVVGLHDLDFLLHWLVCPTRDVEHQQTIFNVLDGHRGTVH
ncbi:MAG: DUF494 family protein [Candidatus Hydrogenedentes bacterium]|nr:DUF494 family protein [Candidatus Hydrogenedentota bacterium]